MVSLWWNRGKSWCVDGHFSDQKNTPRISDLFLSNSHFGNGDLPRRPVHVPATEQMQMQVVHRLPAIVTGVHNDPVTTVQFLFARNLRCSGHHMTDQRCIFSQSLRR